MKQVLVTLHASILLVCLLASSAYAAEGGSGTASITFVKERQGSGEAPSSAFRSRRGGSSRDPRDEELYGRGLEAFLDTGLDPEDNTVIVLDPVALASLGNLPETGRSTTGPNG